MHNFLLLPPTSLLLLHLLPAAGCPPAASYLVANSVFLVGIFSFAAILGEWGGGTWLVVRSSRHTCCAATWVQGCSRGHQARGPLAHSVTLLPATASQHTIATYHPACVHRYRE